MRAIGLAATRTGNDTNAALTALAANPSLYQATNANLTALANDPTIYQATNVNLTKLATLNGVDLTNLSPASIVLAKLGSPAFSNVQHMQNIVHSTGWADGGAISDAGGGAVNVASGTGFIKATDSTTNVLYWTNWAATNGLTLTDANVNYIYDDYNAGSSQVTANTVDPTGDRRKILLARIYREGTTLHIFSGVRWTVGDHASLMMRNMAETMPFAHVSGAMTEEAGTRNLTICRVSCIPESAG